METENQALETRSQELETRNQARERDVRELEAEAEVVQEAQPKVEAFDAVMSTEGDVPSFSIAGF